MPFLAYFLFLLIPALAQETDGVDRSKIEIESTGAYLAYRVTTVDAGPAEGNILNAHYFPGLNLYNAGRYKEAEEQFTYVILRPHYLEQNARRPEFMSTSYYLRGMVYLHHAKGVGRHTAAKADFDAALKWNPRNDIVYIEMARLYSSLGFNEQAATILRHLLELKPEEKIALEAQSELNKLTQTANAR